MRYKYYLVNGATGETLGGSDNKEELKEEAMKSKEKLYVVSEENWKRFYDIPDWLEGIE